MKLVTTLLFILTWLLLTSVKPVKAANSCQAWSLLDILVDKHNSIAPSFTPIDLVRLDGQLVRGEAAAQLKLMRAGMERDGLSFKIVSGFRSNAGQAATYQQWTRVLGYSTIRRAAAPGFSEHQLGTAVDLSISYPSRQWSWLDKNAHKYGFVMSYRGTQQAETGYLFEPWHWRYVGVELATKIRSSTSLPQSFYRKISCS